MNRSLLNKVHNFLAIAAKSDDGKVNKKNAEKLAKDLKKYLKVNEEFDHNQRETLSHLNPFVPKEPGEQRIILKGSELSEPAINLTTKESD